MSRMLLTAVLSVAFCSLTGLSKDEAPAKKDNVPPPGFTALFNGKDLTGWKGAVDIGTRAKVSPEELEKRQKAANEKAFKMWFVEDGAIRLVPEKGGVNLATDKDYGDFELLIDWKIEAKGDSGLYLRGTPQVQIWDSDNLADNLKEDRGLGSGGLWNNPKDNEKYKKGQKPLKKADKPVGEWNTFRIIMKGENVTIFLNDVKIIDDAALAPYKPFSAELPKKGPIELQFHGDKLWFKNIFIKELK
ncbi:MAG: DUF1080 domain-containing protein [Gemmataceae bacterium]|nr:DUF1080 domain-containing protein [Gemmataceae bacterium]